ncbi:MAG: hypothetical protein ACPGJV_13555 [Bacteriovoracaceae bacterium]
MKLPTTLLLSLLSIISVSCSKISKDKKSFNKCHAKCEKKFKEVTFLYTRATLSYADPNQISGMKSPIGYRKKDIYSSYDVRLFSSQQNHLKGHIQSFETYKLSDKANKMINILLNNKPKAYYSQKQTNSDFISRYGHLDFFHSATPAPYFEKTIEFNTSRVPAQNKSINIEPYINNIFSNLKALGISQSTIIRIKLIDRGELIGTAFLLPTHYGYKLHAHEGLNIKVDSPASLDFTPQKLDISPAHFASLEDRISKFTSKDWVLIRTDFFNDLTTKDGNTLTQEYFELLKEGKVLQEKLSKFSNNDILTKTLYRDTKENFRSILRLLTDTHLLMDNYNCIPKITYVLTQNKYKALFRSPSSSTNILDNEILNASNKFLKQNKYPRLCE